MATRTILKDPDATLDYEFDWEDWLTPIADTIASVAWVLTDGLTLVSDSNTAMAAIAFVSGGVEDDIEVLTCRITTAGGRIEDRSVNLKITHR